jgi:Transposase DDE domain
MGGSPGILVVGYIHPGTGRSPPMPPRILPILDRLRQDLAAELTPDSIKAACEEEKYTWRKRLLDPVTTIYLFILQILHGNTSCQHTTHFGEWNFTDSAYCAARKRLPLAVFQRLMRQLADTFKKSIGSDADSKWRGHRVWLIDGSSFSMPDTPELQKAFGQPGNQKRGCGFPVAKFLALFDLATGMLLSVAPAPLRSHEMSRCTVATAGLAAGDIVLGDRGFCSFAHLATLLNRKQHGVFRAHQRQIIDFTPGRPGGPRGKRKRPNAVIRPNSRWVRSQGDADQVVIWYKPKIKPTWISKEEYALLPEEITVRELRYDVHTPGYRVGEVTLVTTLLDASQYPASALADLYFRRWQVEVYLRDLKITLKMDVLKCETADGVLKELAVFALVYNMVRSVACESAKVQGVAPDRVSVIDTVRWLVGAEGDEDLSVILINPSRKGRNEPRVKKRRPKQYPLMTKPRAELRKELLGEKVAA